MPRVGGGEKNEDAGSQEEPMLDHVLEGVGVRVDPGVPCPEDHKTQNRETSLRVDVSQLHWWIADSTWEGAQRMITSPPSKIWGNQPESR